MVINLKLIASVGSYRHASREHRCREHNRLLSAPFLVELLNINKQHFSSHSRIKSILESFESRKNRNNIRINIIIALCLEHSVNCAAVKEYRILSRSDYQFGSFFDFVLPELMKHLLFVSFVPLYYT